MCRKFDEGHGSHPGLEPSGCDCRFTREKKELKKMEPCKVQDAQAACWQRKEQGFY